MQLSVKDIADNANMIINGYAYTKDGDYIRVLNLNCLNNAAVIYKDKIVETNMDDIEIQIVLDYYNKNASSFAEATVDVDFYDTQKYFQNLLPGQGYMVLEYK